MWLEDTAELAVINQGVVLEIGEVYAGFGLEGTLREFHAHQTTLAHPKAGLSFNNKPVLTE